MTFADWLRELQGRVVSAFEGLEVEHGGEPHAFLRDAWQRPNGAALRGQGVSCILENGHVFERAAVLLSTVEGDALPPAATATRPELAGRPFSAHGVSVVVHPRNPWVPTAHANVRMLATQDGAGSWLGGGFDLTPIYPHDEDVRHWHRTARAACEPFGAHLYALFKARCDTYFFLPHRGETRGVGGLFLDDLTAGSHAGLTDRATCEALIRSVGEAFLPAYAPIVARRAGLAWGERERAFQLLRRGRYAEFNLAFDRGTLFGLQSGGRTESILASLPPLAAWRYDWQPEPGSPEAGLADYLKPRDWL